MRHTSAVAELESVQLEFLKLQEQYSSLVIERDIAVRKAEEAVSTCREVDMKLEELTLELISAKENLELAHSTHLEAEEHRIGASLAREQDCLTWENELKEREEELKILNEKYASTKDLKSKLNAATSTLGKLKAELAAYMETKLFEEMANMGDDGASEVREMKRSIEEALEKAKKELEEVKGNVEKAKNEMEILKVANVSIKSELDNEKSSLLTLQQREGMASIAVTSLEVELDRTKEELEVVSCSASRLLVQSTDFTNLRPNGPLSFLFYFISINIGINNQPSIYSPKALNLGYQPHMLLIY